MLRNIILTMACVSAFTAGAQALTVSFSDAVGRPETFVGLSDRKGLSKYDAKMIEVMPDDKGCFTLDSIRLDGMDFCPAWLFVGDEVFPFIFQPGSKLELKVTERPDSVVNVVYKGSNAAASEYFGRYESAFDYERFFVYPPENDTVSVESKRKLLDGSYRKLMSELKRLPKGDVRTFLDRLTRDAYLNYQIRFCGDDRRKADELMSGVDLNSWIGLYNNIPVWAFENKLSRPDYDADMTSWGLEYLEALKTKITDTAVRDFLLGSCAEQVIGWGHCDNIDDFWTPFVALAGENSRVVRRYEDKVRSLKRNKPGMPAIDFTFKDRDGNSHRISDYFGKVLYIDLWASWCGPCRKEIPYIETHYKEYYKDNDKVSFISISIDEDRDAWLRLIDKDKPEWLQFIASGEESRALSKAYGIMGIPRFLLINADGTIADADAFRPSDETFRQKLDEVISVSK